MVLPLGQLGRTSMSEFRTSVAARRNKPAPRLPDRCHCGLMPGSASSSVTKVPAGTEAPGCGSCSLITY